MANIHLKTTRNGGSIDFKDPTMPKYVGARAVVTRSENGVTITLSDYKGTTTETIAEAISDIVTNNDGSLTFVLPDEREITTGSLTGPAGADGAPGTTDYNDLENKPNLATVATSGSYNDLSNKPTIPAKNIWYATCTTAADTVAKEATSSSGDFDLETGNMVRVRFSNTNTAAGATLSVDGCTAKAIWRDGHANAIVNVWQNSEVVDLVYNGVSFVMSNGGMATTTVYGATRLNSATDSTSVTEAATPSAVKTAYDLANGKSTVSVSQITSTGTNIADITVNGTTTHLYAPSGGGGNDGVFVATFNTTPFADVDDAVNDGKFVVCVFTYNDKTYYATLSEYYSTYDRYVFTFMVSPELALISVQEDGWLIESITFPTTERATTGSDGLMSSTDKTKLNGIASGAEVNVQSDWNVTNTTSDAYIKNKPTNVSSFTNDAGYLTLATLPTYNGGVS